MICIQDSFGTDGSAVLGGATRSLAPEVDGKLHELMTTFEVAWASAWGAEANAELKPILGLPPLKYVSFESAGELGANYKLDGIGTFVAEPRGTDFPNRLYRL